MSRSRQNSSRSDAPDGKVNVEYSSQGVIPQGARQLSNNQVHKICRSVEFGSVITTSLVADTVYGLAFTLSDIGDVASWAAVFDQYRIRLIELWLSPSGATGTPNDYVTAFDPNQSATPASFVAVDDYSNSKVSGGTASRYMRFRPGKRISNPTAGFMIDYDSWLDTGSTSTPHYGFVSAFKISSTVVQQYTLRARYHVEFRVSR
jgi:hypothetical protein